MPNIALIEGNKLSDSGSDLTAISGQTYSRLHSGRDFPNGTLIETTINYSLTNGDPWVLEITGNSYFSLTPFDLTYQGYIYNDTMIAMGGMSIGTTITGMSLFNYNGKLCFWFPSQGYWQGFHVYAYTAQSGRKQNLVTAITNVAKPAGITKELSMTFQQVVRTSSSTVGTANYVPKFTGNGILADSQIFDNGTNIGIGVTPVATTLGRSLSINSVGNGLFSYDVGNSYLTQNTYYNGAWKYANTAPAAQYILFGGEHLFSTAPSGTAGNNVTLTERMRITQGGNVGIGTDNPSGRLDVNGATSYFGTNGTDTVIYLRGYNAGLTKIQNNSGVSANYNGLSIHTNHTNANSLPSWFFDFGGHDGITFIQDSFTISRKPSGGSFTTLFTVLGSGPVLVGGTTNVGSHRLQVSGNISINGSGTYLDFANGDVRFVNSSGNLSIQTYSATTTLTTKVYISGTGNVGINNTAPYYLLDVNGNIGIRDGNYLYMGHTSLGTNWTVRTRASGSQFQVDAASFRFADVGYTNAITWIAGIANGNVGVGTASPTARLNVEVNVAAASTPAASMTFSNVTDGGHRVLFKSSTGDLVAIDGDITSTGAGTNDGVLKFWTSVDGVLSERMRISSGGNVTITNLAGTGTRIVVADASGVLSATTVSSSLVGGSGTVNRVAKFTATGTVGDSQIFDNGTSVGIGTTTPSTKLTISGSDDAAATGVLEITTSGGTNLKIGGNTTYSWIQSHQSKPLYINILGNNTIINGGTGNVGIGTTTPAFKLDVNGAVNTNSYFRTTDSTNGLITNTITALSTGIKLNTNSATRPITFEIDSSEKMRVHTDGNVGIGQVSPQRPLHITTANGTASQIQIGQTSQRDYYIGIPASQTYLDFYDASAGASRMAVFSDGNVAINTLTNAGYKFDVNGTTRFGGTTTFNSTIVQKNFSSIIISNLSASATQARQFEILRGFYDYNDWSSSIGVVEIEVYESYYSRGLKKVYTFTYGYFDSSNLALTEMTGTGDNLFRVTMGAKVLISGDMYYVPVYVEVRAYGAVDVVIRTRRTITTNNLSTNPGNLYVNETPTAVNISDFTSDTTVYPNNGANNHIILGNLGIGTTTPAYKLQVSGVSNFGDGSFVISGPSNSTSYYDQSPGAYFHTPQVMIREDQSSTVPAEMAASLVLYNKNGTDNTGNKLVFAANETTSTSANAVATAAIVSQKVSGTTGQWASGNLKFLIKAGVTYVDAMTITSGGNVGIGTGSPAYKLDVAGQGRFTGQGTGTAIIGDAGFTSNYTGISLNGTLSTSSYNILSSPTEQTLYINRPSSFGIRFREANGDQMIIASGGNVGINTITPEYKLQVVGQGGSVSTTIMAVATTDDPGITAYSTSTTGKPHIKLLNGLYSHKIWLSGDGTGDLNFAVDYASTTPKVVFKGNGNVGIGTSSPTFVVGGGLHVKMAGDTNIRITAGSNTGFDLAQASDGTNYIYNRDNSAFVFGTNNSERVRIAADGKLIVNSSTSFGAYQFQVNGAAYISGQTTLANLAGTGSRMVVADANGLLSTQAIPSGGGGSGTVTSVGLTVGSSGTDVNVSNSPITTSGNITLNIPDASATARGLVNTGTQTFAGDKTFTGTTTLNSTRTSITNGSYGMYMLTTYNIALATSNVNVYTSVDALTLNLTNGALSGNETFNVTANLNQVSVAGNASTISTQPIRGIISGILGIPSAATMNIADFRYFEAKTPDRAALTGHIVQTIYGLKISQLKGATGYTITNGWGIYQEGTQDNNYFAGNVIVGSTTVGSYKLDVTNNFRVNTGTVPVAIESFSNPGIGTVASVYSTGSASTIAFGSQANDTYLVGGYVFIGNQSAKFMIQADTLTGAYDGWGSIGASNKYMKEVYTNYLVDNAVFNRQTGSYTLVSGDRSKVIEMNVASANTLTVPTNASVAFPIGTKITVIQYGAGQTTIAGAGVTFRSTNSWLKINARYGSATLVKVGTDEWYVVGNLSA